MYIFCVIRKGLVSSAASVFCQLKFNICVRCDMAFIEPMHHNKLNITYLLTWNIMLIHDFIHDSFMTHWGQVRHICIGKLTIIDSDNGLEPSRHQAIIWTNAGIVLIGPLRTNFSEIFDWNSNIFIEENTLENVACNMLSISSWLQCATIPLGQQDDLSDYSSWLGYG